MELDPHYPRTYELGRGLTFTWIHGGGFAPGALLWRLAGFPFLVVDAGQA